MVRWGGLISVVGGALLILSEIVEVAGGGFSPTSFVVTIAAFFVLSAGIWGLHAGHAAGGGRISFLGSALFSTGAFLEALADVIDFGSTTEAELQARTGLLVPVGFSVLIVGAILFGVAVLRAGVYPRWTGVALMFAPVTLPLITTLGLPFILTSVANTVLGAAILVMGLRILPGLTLRLT